MVEKMKEEFEVTTNNVDVYVGLQIFRDRTKLKFCMLAKVSSVLGLKLPHL
jgi:hypothetical protein